MAARSQVVDKLDLLQSQLDVLSLSGQQDDKTTSSQIRADLVNLSENLSKESTNLALALRPPVSLDACKACLDKIGDYYKKVAYLRAVAKDQTGHSTWSKELADTAGRVVESVKQCVPLWKKCAAASTNTTDRKALLSHTARIWEQTLTLRETLSQNEREAHVKVWQTELELLRDALEQAEEEKEDDDEEGARKYEQIKVTTSLLSELVKQPQTIESDEELERITAHVSKLSAAADDLLDDEPESEAKLQQHLRDIVAASSKLSKWTEAINNAFDGDEV